MPDGMREAPSNGEKLVTYARELARQVEELSFQPPITHWYNPLSYARAPHEAYIRRYSGGWTRALFWGMNPGPWGMAQTGVPFGEVAAVRDWMGINEQVDRPRRPHPKRPVEGFSCAKSEVSGRRLWGLMERRFGTAEEFFADHFVANYCPLVFMEQSGRNRTPDKLPASERETLFALCDEHARKVITTLAPEWVIGVGRFAEGRLRSVVERLPEAQRRGVKVAGILHPSPANPRANREWAAVVEAQLTRLGVW